MLVVKVLGTNEQQKVLCSLLEAVSDFDILTSKVCRFALVCKTRLLERSIYSFLLCQ